MQYLVKVNCETDFPVMLFLAVANGNVVRAVFVLDCLKVL